MIKRLVIAVLLLLAFSAGTAAFFLYTSTGLRAATFLVSNLSAGRLVIGDSHGRLVDDWRLEHITVHGDGIDVAIESLSCVWEPARLRERIFQAAQLLAENVEVTVKEQSQDSGPEQGGFIPPQISLPLAIFVSSLEIKELDVVTLGGAHIYTLDSFSSQFSAAGDRLEISEVQFSSRYLSGAAEASLRLSGDWPIEVEAIVRASPPGCSNIDARLMVSQTLSAPRIELSVSDPASVRLELGIDQLFGAPSFTAALSGDSLELGGFCSGMPDARLDLQLTGSGQLNGIEGSATATLQLPEALPVAAQLDFGFDGEALRIDNGIVGYGSNQAAVEGTATVTPDLTWDGVVVVDSFDLSEVAPVPLTRIGGRALVSGMYDGDKLAYGADIKELEISVDELGLKVGGDLTLAGDQHGLEITTCRIDCGEGRLNLAGTLSWADGFKWATEMELEDFDPAEIGALPEGSINGSFSSRGTIAETEVLVETEIASLSGELSGYELQGGGTLVYKDQVLTIASLNVTNGNNRFYATGTVTDSFDLNFVFNGAELERILPRLGGTLDVTGVLGGPRSEPLAQLTVKGSELKYDDYFAGRMTAEVDLAPANLWTSSVLRIENLHLAGVQAEELDLEAEGTLTAHELRGTLALAGTRVETETSGSVEERSWRGSIDTLAVHDSRFGTWEQQRPTSLHLQEDEAVLEQLCLSSAANQICAKAGWENAGGWSVALEEVRLALASLNDWGIFSPPIDGTIAAELRVAGVGTNLVSGSGTVSLPELEIDFGDTPYYDDYIWYDTSLSLYLQDQDLTARVASRFVDGSQLSGTVTLEDGAAFAGEFTGLPLQGRIEADIRDLDILSMVTSNFLVPEGRLYARLDLSGTLEDPAVEGDVLLQDGAMRIPMLGVQLTEVAGALGFKGRRLLLDLEGNSGSGAIRAAGQFDFGREPWEGSLTLSGTNAELLNRRAISLTADPQLELKIGPAGGSLIGRVAVPEALIEVEKIDRSTSESSDVVFVDQLTDSSAWPFHYDIKVMLGENVRVIGHGLTGRLEGQLQVASNENNITVGRGRLDVVDGSFAIYGSPLTIDRGRLSFSGGPVDNPGLDIRASKKVGESGFGSDGVEVGVSLTGSAADFEMELYAVPSMEDADILAYIILDKPLGSNGDANAGIISAAAEAIGLGRGSKMLSDVSALLPVDDIRVEGRMENRETSLVVGKNLSEELSVSYDYNLFKNAGSFRVRYQFGKGFSVESRNSLESNAVELLYSLER